MAVRDTDELLLAAVKETVAALKDRTDADTALIRLAEQYAEAIDNSGHHCKGCTDDECKRESRSWAMRWIGPLLHDALESLGATPVARLKGQPRTGSQPGGGGKLAALRSAHHGASA